MTRPAVTYLIGDLATDTVVGEAQFETFDFTESLNRPGSWNATHNLDSDAAELLEPRAASIYVDVGGLIVFGGVLWDDEDLIGKAPKSRFIGQGFLSLYREGRRTIRSRNGMTYATGENIGDVVWQDVDAFHVVTDIFDHAATYAGDLGFTPRFYGPGTAGIADVNRSRNVYGYERKGIGETLEALAAQYPPFDFKVSFGYENGAPVRYLDLFYPRLGSSSADTVFEVGRNVELTRRSRSGAKSANVITAVGAGSGDGALTAEALDPTVIAPAGQYPRLEAVTNYRAEDVMASLEAHAHADLAALKADVATFELEVIETEETSITSYGLGQSVRVIIERGRLHVDSRQRIVQRSVSFNAQGGYKIKVTTALEAATLGTA